MPRKKKQKSPEEKLVQIINRLSIKDWRQFDRVDLEFHPKVSMIVGANGTGKTSILNILATVFSNPVVGYEGFVSTPQSCILGTTIWRRNHLTNSKLLPTQQLALGSIRVNNGPLHAVTSYQTTSRVTGISVSKKEEVVGTHISAYRAPVVLDMHRTSRDPIGKPSEVLQRYLSEYHKLVNGTSREKNFIHPWTIIKDWLYKLATTASTNEFCQGDQDGLKVLEDFVAVLRIVLPSSIKFAGLEVRGNEIVFKTESSEFNLDALSGGLGTLFNICFQIYLCSLRSQNFVVTFDEPENHLHVKMQRTLLPDLQIAFPHAQFIVATHSPVIVNSVEDSSVFVLQWTEEQRVNCSELHEIVKSGTANDILKDVLGVDSALPIWAAAKLENIVDRYVRKSITVESMAELHEELKQAGLVQYAASVSLSVIETIDHD